MTESWTYSALDATLTPLYVGRASRKPWLRFAEHRTRSAWYPHAKYLVAFEHSGYDSMRQHEQELYDKFEPEYNDRLPGTGEAAMIDIRNVIAYYRDEFGRWSPTSAPTKAVLTQKLSTAAPPENLED